MFSQKIYLQKNDFRMIKRFECSNVKKGKKMFLKIVQNNDTMKLGLFSTVESHILTNKNVTQMTKRIK